MFKIQLTTGVAWDAPVLEEHFVKAGIHIVYVERLAERLLIDARREPKRIGPTNYRVIDHFGKCVRSSITSKARRSRRASRSALLSSGAPRLR